MFPMNIWGWQKEIWRIKSAEDSTSPTMTTKNFWNSCLFYIDKIQPGATEQDGCHLLIIQKDFAAADPT